MRRFGPLGQRLEGWEERCARPAGQGASAGLSLSQCTLGPRRIEGLVANSGSVHSRVSDSGEECQTTGTEQEHQDRNACLSRLEHL